jgi:NADH-ubiquinone oxidoreductase chain 1
MCILSSILFFGGYLLWGLEQYLIYYPLQGLLYGLSLGLKSSILVFIFIWVRASFPRIRFDQLMLFCWTVLLPIVFAIIVLMPCMLYIFNILVVNINLF